MGTLQSAERLTIERSRSIVEYAEAIFEQGQPIADAFEPFAAGGAVDRFEAYTALLLVIADYFAMVNRLTRKEQERYEGYVKHSRSVVIRVVCDGVKHSETATDLILDSGGSFDQYTQWLSLQDPKNHAFWPAVYKRLGIDRATANILQPSTIQTLDMDQLTELVGCAYQLPSNRAELHETGFDIQSGSRNSQYFTCKRDGVSILLEESVITAIFLYRENSDGYATFPRPLSGNIAFGARRSRVRSALGQPDESNSIAYVYDRGRYRVTFEFREWIGTLKLIVIQQNFRSNA